MKHYQGFNGRHRFDYYVDSVAGSNSNPGLTPLLPKQTLSSLTVANNKKIALKYGSTFRESFNSSSYIGVVLQAYGNANDGSPVIDGTNIISVWTAEGNPDVWQATISHDAAGSDRLTVYDNFSLYTRVADVSTCSSTPGSFVDVYGSLGTPLTIKIHTSDSTNPNSNGRSYEVTARDTGISLGASSLISGIRTQRVISNNGSYQSLVRSNCAINRILSVYGTKHNLTAGDGGSVNDIIVLRVDPPTAGEPVNAMFTQFVSDAANKSLVINRLFVAADGYPGQGHGSTEASYAHDAAVNQYTTQTATMVSALDIDYPATFRALTVNVTGLFSRNQINPITIYANDSTVKYFQVQATTDSQFIDINTATTTAIFRIQDSVVYDTSSNNPLIRLSSNHNGSTIQLDRLTIYHASRHPTIHDIGMTSGTIYMRNCIHVVTDAGFFSGQIVIPSGVTYIGDNNVFVSSLDSKDNLNLIYNGVTYNTLAAWQVATGQDTNSIVLGPTDLTTLFSGTISNGDFRLKTTGSGLLASNLSAGPSTHLNWNTASAASGPPSAWPNIPDTLSKANTYMIDPTAWVF